MNYYQSEIKDLLDEMSDILKQNYIDDYHQERLIEINEELKRLYIIALFDNVNPWI